MNRLSNESIPPTLSSSVRFLKSTTTSAIRQLSSQKKSAFPHAMSRFYINLFHKPKLIHMARQSGAFPLRGTLGEVTFYQLNGVYRIRRKTSLDKRRLKKDPAFANTRRSSDRLATASKIAKQFYRTIFPHQLQNGLKTWHPIWRRTIQMVKAGIEAAAILEQLKEEFLPKSVAQGPKQNDYMDGFCGS